MSPEERTRVVGRLAPWKLRSLILVLAELDPAAADLLIQGTADATPVPVHVPGQIELPC